MIRAGIGPVVKSGGQGARAPTIHNVPIVKQIANTTPIAQGRRAGLRSPRFEMAGTSSRTISATSGPRTIT